MINNLKTNEEILTKEKIKLQKKHVVPATLMLCATMLLTGCSGRNYYNYAIIRTSETTTTIENTTTTDEVDEYYNEIYLNNASKRVTEDNKEDKFNFIETEEMDQLLEQLGSYNADYTYEYVYQPEESLKMYEAETKFSNNHQKILENVTVTSLYNKVLENNKNYLESKNICFYDEMSKSDIKKICEYIVETYNEYLINENINIEETKCILNNLKIFEGSSAANAFINDEYCLVVSPGMIDVLEIMNDNKEVDVFKNTIIHETMHIAQMSCPDHISETVKMIGTTPQYQDLSLNPLDFSWYYEASAEKCTVNYTNDDPLVYEYMINYLESLSLATILNNNVKVSQNETNCYTKDLNSIFEMFDCTTEEEKIEIINMLYSIQIIEVEPEEFFNSLNNELTRDETSVLKKDLRSSICSTLTKYFYINLIEQTKNKDVTLQDLFFIITLFENDINSHINYNTQENYYYYGDFLTYYKQIQNDFFKVVASSSGYSYESILEQFNDYSLYKIVNNNQEYNATLEWLDEKKQQYLSERQQYLAEYSTANIQFVIEKRNMENELKNNR